MFDRTDAPMLHAPRSAIEMYFYIAITCQVCNHHPLNSIHYWPCFFNNDITQIHKLLPMIDFSRVSFITIVIHCTVVCELKKSKSSACFLNRMLVRKLNQLHEINAAVLMASAS